MRGVFNNLEPKKKVREENHYSHSPPTKIYKFSIILVKIVQLGVVIYVYIYLHTPNIQVYLSIQHLNKYKPDCDTQFFHPWTHRTLLKYWYDVLLLVKNVSFRPKK